MPAKAVPGQIARWVPGQYTWPGTDGWGLLRHRAGKIPRPARPGDRQVPLDLLVSEALS